MGTMHGHGNAIRPIRCWPCWPCWPCWFRQVFSPSGDGPTRDREIGRNENAWPPDCSRSRCRSERHDTQAHAVHMRLSHLSWAESRAKIEKQPHQVVSYTSGRRRGGRVVPKTRRSVASSSGKPALEEGMEIGRSLSSRGAKRRCAVSPAKPQFPYGGGAR